MRRHSGYGSALLWLVLWVCTGAAAEEVEQSIIAPLAQQSLLLDIASTDGLYVAVGERGHVLLSTDGGENWRQVQVPTRATLTGVYFHDRAHGWAVGHDAVILRTEDGGESWDRVYSDPEAFRPLLDVWFRDERQGYAVGAYGYFLETDDGGRSWRERDLTAERLAPAATEAGGAEADASGQAEDADEAWYALDQLDFSQGVTIHLNKIARANNGFLFMAAETGVIFRSSDDGQTWQTLSSPYDGSFFGLLPLEGRSLLIFGLRGHLFRSDDSGVSWDEILTDSQAMLTDAVRLVDGRIVVTGLAGTLLLSSDGARSFAVHRRPDRDGLQALVAAGGALVVVGEGGVRRLEAEPLDGGGQP